MAEDTLLRAEGLTRVFRGKDNTVFPAVDHISFSLKRGTCLALVGESGSGKSTTVRMITGLLPVSEGTIEMDGEDITSLKGKKRRDIYRRMQMVFQSPQESFDPRRTLGFGIGESLSNTGMSRSEVKKKVEDLLVECGLDASFADKYPHEVSGGECQRAAIARAIAVNPELLILDEATSALDVTVQKQVIDLLSRLKEERHMSYFFICHDLALVQSFSDYVLVMNHGIIVEEGTPDEVIQHPREEYTKVLLDSVL